VAIGDRVLDWRGAGRRRGRPRRLRAAEPQRLPRRGPGGLGLDPPRRATSAQPPEELEPHLVPLDEVRLHLPIEVADYVDFYASEHHAGNVGRIFRPDGPPLTPNWKHMPIGYHGRAGTVVVSGSEIVRPPGPAEGSERPCAAVRTESQAGHRGRARLGGRRGARRSGSRSRSTASPSMSSGW
jgi:fumarylacetoacetase